MLPHQDITGHFTHFIHQEWSVLKELKNYQALLDSFTEYDEKWAQCDTVLVLGTGGSSLGARALCSLKYKEDKRKIIFIDNIDSDYFSHTLESINPKKCIVLVISKSGNTPETLMQLSCLMDQWKSLSFNWEQQSLCITENSDNALRHLAKTYHLPILDHPSDVGGRFSVFTIVGLFPSFLAGINCQEFCKGALDALPKTSNEDQHPAVLGASSFASFYEKGIHELVIMVYCNRLLHFADWSIQLWSESLGKKTSEGQRKGPSIIKALGATDQHSQLQLFIDGPENKYFAFYTLEKHKNIPSKNMEIDHPVLKKLEGKSMEELMMAEQKATIDVLRAHKKPIRHTELEILDEYVLGTLMMNSMLEVIYIAQLWNIDAFNQPAVEEGKIKAYEYLEKYGQ
ncbi:MAG: hypothetical protein C0432_04000 [Candidatus Puniceispirillum sp.]|nr:hypothetical protein [Candidatus Pelagibacter sp.]MBA4283438.1 hypothetical protein [Candidatus Puniceispirillum sp.]